MQNVIEPSFQVTNIALNSAPRVSVILCTFCGTRHLEKQLQSLLTQTLKPFELIVCDDHSGDDTVAMVEEFRSEAPFPVRIVVNERNLGSTANFDQGMEMATGDYLALCDQDDEWYPRKLEALSAVLEARPDVGCVFSDATLIDGNGTSMGGQTLFSLHGFNPVRQRKFLNGNAIDVLLQHDVITGATLMVRASLRPKWHPIPASWVHDGWMTWMLAVYSKIELVREPLVGYRIHAQQQLGVGKRSRTERLKHMRATERARYASVAAQFGDLRQAVEGALLPPSQLPSLLSRKILFLQERSRLSHNGLRRFFFVLSHVASYQRFARGWRSMRKDLLLS